MSEIENLREQLHWALANVQNIRDQLAELENEYPNLTEAEKSVYDTLQQEAIQSQGQSEFNKKFYVKGKPYLATLELDFGGPESFRIQEMDEEGKYVA